jgi:hypothetical protein
VASDVERVLGGVAPHLMVTDPPYGVSYDPAWRNRAAAQGIIGQKKASRAIGEVVNDDPADWREAWALFPGSVAYIWHAGTKAGIVQDSLAACGFETRAQIIWAKNNFAIGRGHYHAIASATMYSSLRNLLPPNAKPELQSSRLAKISRIRTLGLGISGEPLTEQSPTIIIAVSIDR